VFVQSGKEYRRQSEVVDLAISGHSLLRDRYERRGAVLIFVILGLSVVATALALLNGEREYELFGVTQHAVVIVGSLTALIFFLTLIELRLDFRGRARAHADASRRLAELKAKYRAAVRAGDDVTSDLDLAAEYERVMSIVATIPESKFLWVKAKHRRKVLVSRLISQHPGAPLLFVQVLATIQGFRGSPQGSGSPSREE
jgi:hypothetical protein